MTAPADNDNHFMQLLEQLAANYHRTVAQVRAARLVSRIADASNGSLASPGIIENKRPRNGSETGPHERKRRSVTSVCAIERGPAVEGIEG